MKVALTAAACVLALLVACPTARSWQARIPATDEGAAPLLALAADLADRDSLNRVTIEHLLNGVQLAETDHTDAFTFFEARGQPLGVMTLAHVDYREPVPGGSATAGALLVLNVEGPCIQRKMIEESLGPLMLTEAPYGHSAEEQTVWSRGQSDRTISFGFPERDRDCLGTITLQFRAPPRAKDNR